ILEKSEHNVDFHPMVDFVEASPLRYALTFKPTVYVSHIRQFWSTAKIETTEEETKILATVDGILRTVTESSRRRNLKLQDEEGIILVFQEGLFPFATMLVPQGEGSGTPTEPHHTPSPEAQQPSHTTHSSPTIPFVSTISIPPVTSSDTPPIRQYTRRTRIAQSSVLPPAADEPASPLRDVSQGEACPTDSGFLMIQHYRLKARVKLLEDKEGVAAKGSGDDAPIKGRNLDEGEAAAERVSDDTKEMATVLTSMDATIVLAIGAAEVPTGSGSIPTAGPSAAEVPTGSDVVPTASLVFATATVVTPYRRRKGKEVMVEYETPKKQKVQQQIDPQVARELEEQLEREDQRMSEQIARDAEVIRIHVKKELQSMIDGLDRINETVAKYPQEYQQFASKLPLERRIELISDLVRSNLGWKVKDFRGMSFEEIEAKFTTVWKQLEDFIPMSSKEEAKRLKRRGLSLEQESAKKFKPSNEVPKEVKSPDEVLEEKHMDREDLNQLWALVKESLRNRPPTSDKEMELWLELKRLYEPDDEDQLWTHT
nr:hypothetical protein [Tanacetum cinerariifolium]